MKNGKRPNKQQKMTMFAAGFSPLAYLVVKNLNDRLVLVHRETGNVVEVMK